MDIDNPDPATSVVTLANHDRPSDNHFAFALHTVTSFRIVGETAVWALSAADAVDHAIRMGFVKAEAAPASAVNGYGDKLPVRHGDTASVDTRHA